MTRPELTLVIPVLNEEALIEEALKRLQHWRPMAEIIVVDGGSEDGTIELAQPLCDRVISSPTGRARQMNAGAAAARGNYLFFLHCDTRLTIEPERLGEVLSERPRWGYFRVRLEGDAWLLRVVAFFMNLRSGLSRIATGDQLLFLHSALFSSIGGYADIALMEDIEICSRLRRLARPRRIYTAVITSSRRWEENGIARTIFTMWKLRLAWWLGANPGKLAEIYHGG